MSGRGFAPDQPTSEDICVWLRFQAAAGRFDGGKNLPEVTELSRRLAVSARTVRKAYGAFKKKKDSVRPAPIQPLAQGRIKRIASLLDALPVALND